MSNLIEIKIELLKLARSQLESAAHHGRGLCSLLNPTGYVPRYWAACLQLRDYVRGALGGHVWLEAWYEANLGYYPDREQALNARIMWVNWMIAELEKQLEEYV